jgi:hypothetical protein
MEAVLYCGILDLTLATTFSVHVQLRLMFSLLLRIVHTVHVSASLAVVRCTSWSFKVTAAVAAPA